MGTLWERNVIVIFSKKILQPLEVYKWFLERIQEKSNYRIWFREKKYQSEGIESYEIMVKTDIIRGMKQMHCVRFFLYKQEYGQYTLKGFRKEVWNPYKKEVMNPEKELGCLQFLGFEKMELPESDFPLFDQLIETYNEDEVKRLAKEKRREKFLAENPDWKPKLKGKHVKKEIRWSY